VGFASILDLDKKCSNLLHFLSRSAQCYSDVFGPTSSKHTSNEHVFCRVALTDHDVIMQEHERFALKKHSCSLLAPSNISILYVNNPRLFRYFV